jgi:PAS domain S-box-containing protein
LFIAVSKTERINLLYVDDESDLATLVADMLEHEDDLFAVETATSASEGLNKLTADNFDCIVSDYDMPGRNGIEFLEAIRGEYPDLPFILYTGKGSEEVASDAIAAGATDYLQKNGSTEEYGLLANRIRNAVEQYRAQQRATDLDRIRTLVTEINQELVRATSRSDAETRVCEIMSDSDPYLFAWIGGVDSETDRIKPRAWAGVKEGYLDDITVTADETATGQGPGGTAVRERRVAVSQNIQADPEFEAWRDEALERGYQAVAAVPLEYDDILYGVFGVYSEHPDAFDDDEQELLAELGDDIAHAIHSFDLQEQLQAERDQRQALFENAPSPVVAAEVHDGGPEHRIIDVNDAFEEVFGYGPETVIGENVGEVIIPSEERDRYEAFRDRPTAGESITAEVERSTADGIRDFRLHITPYKQNGDGLDGIYAWYTDVTERKAHEETLKELHEATWDLMTATTTEEVATRATEMATQVLNLSMNGVHRYDAGIDALVPIAWTDKTDDLLDGSPPALPLDGSLAGQVYRTGVAQTFADVQETDGTFDSKTPFRSELILPLGGHGVFITSSPEADVFDATDEALADVFAASVEAALDNVEQRQQLQRERDRLKEFAGILSHDLRNPLNVATGSVKLAQTECDSDHLTDVAQALHRMEELVEDVLALVREGDQVEGLELVDLGNIIDGCWGTVETAEATLVTDINQAIYADSGRLKQLLENLFRNAIEHGGKAVTVSVGDLPEKQGFYVADDGPGIPEDEHETVFDAGYSTGETGTGLGLSIVQAIVEAHGWSIALTDSETGGARFEITGVEIDGE